MKSNQHIAVLGAGESGVGCAVLARKQGYKVWLSDIGNIKAPYRQLIVHHNLAFEEGKHSYDKILGADIIIKSPGIPDNIDILKEAKKAGIDVISEIEFAAAFTDAKFVCITGSNGKTTTASLLHHIMVNSGIHAGIAGNIGKSFALQVAENNYDYYVLEVSSFQLDGMFQFKADIAILLNITPDHLDRYNNDFQQYINSKFRITQNQQESDVFIYCADDPVIMNELKKRNIPARQFPFSIQKLIEGDGACLKDSEMNINHKTSIFNMTLEKLALQGKHNIYNSMAASIAARILDIRKDVIKQSLADFQNIEHRLEYVTKVHGIEFINDSKATNVNSCWYALESMTNPVIWIVGGVDKGNDYSLLKTIVQEKVKAIVCMGKDNTKIIRAFKEDIIDIVETTSAKDAVNAAYYLGKPGNTVLLSPACASFDLFDNYEDRGRKFKAAVKEL